MGDFIFDTTGNAATVKFEELGAYYDHPTSAYTLSDEFDINEISNATTVQEEIDSGNIVAYDENGNLITNINYITGTIPTFATDNVSSFKTYIGYGTSGSCKIQEVISSSDGTYTSLWSGGNESFDKNWSGRTGYTYF